MAENPDFLLLEQLFSPSQRAANSMPAPHVSSPMPAQAATYTFNSPLLPTLNKDNVLTAIFGEPGASPELPAPTEEEEERPPKEPANEREKKGQKASRCAGRGEKKNGRPVVFHGDPNDPRLSTEERRLLKRRIVNRESARRVRLRLRTDLEEQQRLIRSSPPLPTNVLRAQLHETQENYSRLKESYNTLRCEFVTLQNCYQAICSDPNV